jgi:hypothetical protein
MKTNFDTLEAAGLVASSADNTGLLKAKAEKRIEELEVLASKISKLEKVVSTLYTLPKPQQLKRLTLVIEAATRLHKSKLPVGAKTNLELCLNELTSLQEGVYLGASVDKKALSLIACRKARKNLSLLIANTQARLVRIEADSSDDDDLETFYRKAEDVINKHMGERGKLTDIATKAFVVARVPVVPTGTPVSTEKLAGLGFKVDNLGGYAVIQNQLVLGINPSKIIPNSSAIKSDKLKAAIQAEAESLRRKLQKTLNTRLQFVSDRPRTYKSGTWYWLMSERDLDLFAKAFPGGHVKVDRWGFAFN